jgi:RNA polymerase sigma-70 factor (ECF subfamily)
MSERVRPTARPDASDEELVTQARESLRGDVTAFETLVTRYESRVVTNCRFLTGSPADAEDLAQEVFTKAYFALRKFEGRSSFGTWVHRIKVNHCLNHLDKRSRRAGNAPT